MILALEIAEDVYEIFQAVSYKPGLKESAASTTLVKYQGLDLDQVDFENNTQEPEKMGLLKRIKRGIEFLGDWFSDQPDDYLITEYGFLRTFVDWD